MVMNLYKSLVKNVSWMFISNILLKIINFVIIIYLVRYFSESEYGVFSFAFAYATIFITISDMGISTLFIKDLSQKKVNKEQMDNVFSLKLAVSLFVFIISSILIFFLGFSNEIILTTLIASISIFFLNLSVYYNSFFRAKQEMQYEAISKVIGLLIGGTWILWALINESSYMSIIIAYSSIYFFMCFFASSIYHIKYKKRNNWSYNWPKWKELLKRSFPFWFSIIFITVSFRMENIFLGKFIDEIAVGVYNIPYKIIEAFSFIPLMVISVLFPVMTQLYTKSKKTLKEIYSTAVRYLFMISLPLTVGIFFVSERVITIVFGEAYLNSAIVLQILIIAGSFYFINILTIHVLYSINKQKAFAKVLCVILSLNILLDIILIKNFSYIGAAISATIVQLVYFLVLFYILQKEFLKLNLIKHIYKPLIASVIMGLLLVYTQFLALWYVVPIAILAYSFLIIILGGFTKQDKWILKNILNRDK